MQRNHKKVGVPIDKHFGSLSKLADMATNIEASKLLVYHAAYLKQRGSHRGKEASIAKLFASKTAVEVTTDAIQVFGDDGYTKEYPVERYFRDAKLRKSMKEQVKFSGWLFTNIC